MNASLRHWEIGAGPLYRKTERELPITEHLRYDASRSKKTHARVFRRYLALLRGLHLESHAKSFAEFQYDGEECVVCSHTSTVMQNTFHKKCPTMFALGHAPFHDTEGMFVEVECDYDLRRLMMCARCHEKWNAHVWPGSEDALDSTQAETILRRFWKLHTYPLVRSVLRE